jgi:trigger factor
MPHNHDNFSVIVSEPKDAIIEISGTINAETIENHRKKVIENVAKEADVPGFRKGHAPKDIIEKQVDQNHVLEDAAEEALSEVYPHILHMHSITPTSAPRVTIVKLALGNPLEFKITVAIAPEVKLPNYKKIAKQIKSKEIKVEVTDTDVENVIKELQELRKDENGVVPEITDDFVKTLGSFESVHDFKTKLKENIKNEKESNASRENFEALVKQLVSESGITLPLPMVDDEVYASLNRLTKDLERRNIALEDYFKNIKKTEEEFIKAKRESIEEQLKTKFIIQEIAKEEKITPDAEQVEAEIKQAMMHYPNLSPEDFKAYIEETLTNEKTLRWLEKAEF